MSVFRVHKISNFTTVNNFLIKDENLSLKEKGMMLVLLSLPEDWDYSVSGLEAICGETKNTINGVLNKLEIFKYLERTKIRDSKGKYVDCKYDIYEVPKDVYYGEFEPYLKKPYMEKPYMENSPQLNTNILNTKELNNTTTDTIYDLLQENGFVLAPLQYEVVSGWDDNELTRYAIKKAVLNNKFNINYIDKILMSYKKNNIKTVEQAIEDDDDFNTKRDNYYKKKYEIKESRYEREKRILEEMCKDEENGS